MQVQRQESGEKGSFYIKENGQKSALMTYKKSGENEITIDHTEVDEAMQGKGLGKQMVSAAVEYARENDIKIVPVCPFVKEIIDETPEYQDVLS
ncbi:MAG: N-acetyltransferase [Acidobacteria bacterium]|jgi:predicted GNAT family acetyltransferase|nr:N-acetyltransferase [Acidobacteriota bacterium]